MTPQTREELKKGFKEIYDYGDDTPIDSYADYWLDKFDQLLIEKQERIEKLTKVCTDEIYNGEALISYKDAINILKE